MKKEIEELKEFNSGEYTGTTRQADITEHHQTVVREYKLRTLNEYKKLLKSIVILEMSTELTLALNEFIDLSDYYVLKSFIFSTQAGDEETSKRIVGVSEVYSTEGRLPTDLTIDDVNSLIGALKISKDFTDAESVYLWEINDEN